MTMAKEKIKAGGAEVEISAVDKLSGTLNKISAKFKAWGAGLRTIGATLFTGAAASLASLTGAAINTGQIASGLTDLREATGISVEGLSELQSAARLSGTDVGALNGGLTAMAKLLTKAAGGSKQAQQTLAQLGLSWEQLAALAPEDRFQALAQAIAAVEDPTLRAGLAMKVFGGSGEALIPMLRQIEELRAQARAAGGLISTADAEQGAAQMAAFNQLWETLRGLMVQVGLAAGEALKPVAEFLAPIVKGIRDFASQNKGLVAGLVIAAAIAAAAGIALIGIGTALSLIGMAVAGVAAIPTILGAIGSVLAFIVSPVGLLIGLIAALVAGVAAGVVWFFRFTESGQRAFAILKAGFAQLWSFVRQVFGGIWDALVAGDWRLAGEIAMHGLKLAWVAGLQALEKLWLDFKGWFLTSLASLLDKVNATELAADLRRSVAAGRREREVEMAMQMQAANRALLMSLAKAAEARAKAFPEKARQGAAAAVQSASSLTGADGTSQGTFSARAAGLLSRHAGDAQEDIADNTERAADGIDELVSMAKEGGLVWS